MSFILDSLDYLDKEYDITLWGVNITEKYDDYIENNGKKYPFKTFSKVILGKKIIPNFLKVTYNMYINKNKILNEHYDILYIHGIPLSFPLFTNSKTKVINHIHGMTNPFAMTPNRLARNKFSINLYEKYRGWIIKKSDMILLASDVIGHKKFSDRFPLLKEKIKYIPNFADTNIFVNLDKSIIRNELNLNPDEIILVNTGRISLQKDPILLIHSFIHLVKNLNINAKLIIIGDGELKSRVEEIIYEENIKDKVIITGKIDRQTINKWLNAADLYVYTSHANGFPISLAESAMCSLPIVTTDVNGVHDLVVDDFSGYLVQERSPTIIANNIIRALEKKEIFSKNILSISNEFSPNNILNIILNHFKDVIK
jgi:glycosyltransferase involved in cell wall biosynthesis